MILSRRSFNSSGLAALAGLALGPALPGILRAAEPVGETLFDWKPIGEKAMVAFGQGGNALLIRAGEESILIDCKHAGLGTTLKREAEALIAPAGAPAGGIRHVINTHHHRDHVGGNHAFTKGGISLYAHTRAKQRILDQVEGLLGSVAGIIKGIEASEKPAPRQALDEIRAFADSIATVKAEDFAPNQMIDRVGEGDPSRFEYMLNLGEIDAEVYHFGPAHTDNDLAIYIPSLNILHMGDLLFHKNHPFIDRSSGATTIGWQKFLGLVIEKCNAATVVIPGHGELTDVSGLKLQIEYFDKMREVVRYAKDVDGMTKEEAMKIEPGAFEGYGLTQIRPRTIAAIYEELEAGK